MKTNYRCILLKEKKGKGETTDLMGVPSHFIHSERTLHTVHRTLVQNKSGKKRGLLKGNANFKVFMDYFSIPG